MEVTGEPPEERVLTPRAAKPRVVLASLLVRADRVVSVDTLADELWGGSPPRTPTATIQVYVSHLRKTLQAADPDGGRDALVTRSPGYVLHPRPGQLDLADFEELHDRGRAALERGDHAAAADLHRRALALWRGPLLADTPHGALLGGAAAWAAEVRVSALEQRVRADLQLGRHRELVGELRSLVAEHPLREELHAHLMLALFRTERQSEALRVYARLREALIDELGTEPGPPLQRLHHRVLAADQELMAPDRALAPPPSVARPGRLAASLPAADPAFTGRVAALAEVERLVRCAPAGGCVAIAGPAGVGKTALAVEAAHRAADAFADGPVFLDLCPPGRGPLSAAEAMGRLVRRAGVPGPLPTDPQELADLVQRLFAGRRTLLVVDNAASEAQVRPLLPTGPGSVTLLTSRRLLAGLRGMRPVVLSAPDRAEAVAMFEAAATLARPVDEPEAVARVVEWCGGLPLALRVAAAQLVARPHWTVATLADRLADEGIRLSGLTAGDVDVRASLRAAYREAPAPERRAFRLLGLVPPGAFGPWLAAAVLGVAAREAQRLLEALVDARLVEVARADGAGPERYRLHALWRLLAVESLADESPATVREATRRMCVAYADAASYADALFAPGRRDDEDVHHRGGAPPDGDTGAPWPGAAPATWATGPESAAHPGHGAWRGVGGGSGAGDPAERAERAERAETIGCGLALSGCGLATGPRQSAAAPTGPAADAPWPAGPRRAPTYPAHLPVSRAPAGPTGAATPPNATGAPRAGLGDPRSWPPAEPVADGRSWYVEAVGPHPLDWFAAERGRLVAVVTAAHAARLWRPTIRLADSLSAGLEALAAWDDWQATHVLALDAARRCGDRRAAARLLRSLGDLHWQRRRLALAREHYRQARLAAWEVADSREYGRTLVALAELSLDAGQVADATRLLTSALAVASTPMDTRGRYEALRALALVALETGDPGAARRSLDECLELAEALRDRRLEDYARRALRALRAGRPRGRTDAPTARWARPSGVEVRPGVWRLRTPAPF
ncbi:AfsR/SARP family transcriptional regulator [Streptomyces youssoufiensis]